MNSKRKAETWKKNRRQLVSNFKKGKNCIQSFVLILTDAEEEKKNLKYSFLVSAKM